MARQWTAEERQRQRELINRVKPWEKSTGARTPEGKARSAKNAYKGGWRQRWRSECLWLKEQKKCLNHALESLD